MARWLTKYIEDNRQSWQDREKMRMMEEKEIEKRIKEPTKKEDEEKKGRKKLTAEDC